LLTKRKVVSRHRDHEEEMTSLDTSEDEEKRRLLLQGEEQLQQQQRVGEEQCEREETIGEENLVSSKCQFAGLHLRRSSTKHHPNSHSGPSFEEITNL